jgi:hypothetical protein
MDGVNRIKSALNQMSQNIQRFFRSPKSTESKTNSAALDSFKMIAKGAEKQVFIPVTPLPTRTPEQAKAYYAPVRNFLGSKEKALRKEHMKMEHIASSAPSAKHLAIQATVVSEGGLADHHGFVLEVDRATNDFEGEIRQNNSVAQRLEYCLQYAAGMQELHDAGYAFGDAKPENCLIYTTPEGTKDLKIADFGKAQPLHAGETTVYKGNLRFAPPEGRMSHAGDVYSTALVLIRTLEETYLNETGDPLIPVSQQDQEAVAALDKRRGIEQLIVNHKAFPGIDEPKISDKLFRRLPRQAKLNSQSAAQKAQQNTVLNNYIQKLTDSLFLSFYQEYISQGFNMHEATELAFQKSNQIDELLSEMVRTDPNKRPTMQQVVQRLQSIPN